MQQRQEISIKMADNEKNEVESKNSADPAIRDSFKEESQLNSL